MIDPSVCRSPTEVCKLFGQFFNPEDMYFFVIGGLASGSSVHHGKPFGGNNNEACSPISEGLVEVVFVAGHKHI